MVHDGYLEGVPELPLNNEAQQLQGLVTGPALQALKLKVFQAMVVWDLIIAMQEQKEQAERLSALYQLHASQAVGWGECQCYRDACG